MKISQIFSCGTGYHSGIRWIMISRPIPIRLDDETILRLRHAGVTCGLKLSQVIKVAIATQLPHFESGHIRIPKQRCWTRGGVRA
jgi:hypothetical protein